MAIYWLTDGQVKVSNYQPYCQLLGKVGGGTVVLRPNNFKDEELEDDAYALLCNKGKIF